MDNLAKQEKPISEMNSLLTLLSSTIQETKELDERVAAVANNINPVIEGLKEPTNKEAEGPGVYQGLLGTLSLEVDKLERINRTMHIIVKHLENQVG